MFIGLCVNLWASLHTDAAPSQRTTCLVVTVNTRLRPTSGWFLSTHTQTAPTLHWPRGNAPGVIESDPDNVWGICPRVDVEKPYRAPHRDHPFDSAHLNAPPEATPV
jgi:hypothetical protein